MKSKGMRMYGMEHRGFGIGCQPMDGFVERIDDSKGRYCDIIVYDRMLTGDEVAKYELIYLGKMD